MKMNSPDYLGDEKNNKAETADYTTEYSTE
jgi:hypothetical protein